MATKSTTDSEISFVCSQTMLFEDFVCLGLAASTNLTDCVIYYNSDDSQGLSFIRNVALEKG